MTFSMIAAVDKNLGIGKNNSLPWNLPSDLKYFSSVTKGAGHNAVIMGRKTWESFSPEHRPLKNRLNIVLSKKNLEVPEGVKKASSLDEALSIAAQHNLEEIFAIGGSAVFHEAIKHPACEILYLTEIDGVFECDTFFPKFSAEEFKKIEESPVQEENGIMFKFVKYSKVILTLRQDI